MRRIYPVKITVNEVRISRVVIDPHYEVKHRSSMIDDLILELVEDLDQGNFLPDDVDENGYQYFTYDAWIRGKSIPAGMAASSRPRLPRGRQRISEASWQEQLRVTVVSMAVMRASRRRRRSVG